MFLSTGEPDKPYIGEILTMWMTRGIKYVKVKWFYHPGDTRGCPKLKDKKVKKIQTNQKGVVG